MKFQIIFVLLALTIATCNGGLLSYTFDVQPGQSQNFQNPVPFQIDVTCTVETSAPSEFCGNLVSGYGVIFGTNYSAPASACFNVTNGESIPITASGSGQIQFQNKGKVEVKAVCSPNLMSTMTNFISQTFNIAPGASQKISNPLFFKISATCQVSTTGSQQLCGSIISGSGEINGQDVTSGTKCLTLSNGQSFTALADGSSSFELENEGNAPVQLVCTANFLQQQQTEFITANITLAAGQTQNITNPMFFTVSATCQTFTTGSNQVCGRILKGKGVFEDISLSTGQQSCATLTNGENIAVKADGFSQSEITNNGKNDIVLSCTAQF